MFMRRGRWTRHNAAKSGRPHRLAWRVGVLTVALMASVVAATNATPVLELSLDETSGGTATDSSGEGNDGSLTGASWITGGRYGGGASFDGVDDWITVPDDDSLDLDDSGTLEAWVKPTSTTSWSTVLFKEDVSAMAYGLYAGDGGGPTLNACLGEECIYASDVEQDVWSHLAFTFDGDTMKLYVNGALAAQQAQIGTPSATSGALRIGGNNVWGEYFEGVVDEVRVHDDARTISQIRDDRDTSIGLHPDVVSPTASIEFPEEDATVDGWITLEAEASDDRGVRSVQFRLDGEPVGTPMSSAPYEFEINTRHLDNGPHYVDVEAIDTAGNHGYSSQHSPPTSFTVYNELPRENPVLALSFDEGSGSTAADTSAEGNDGTISGAAWDNDGKFGKALSFDGIDDWVTVPDDQTLDLVAEGTIEAWVKPQNVESWATAVLKEADPGMAYGLYAADGDSRQANGCVGEVCAYSPGELEDDEWAYVALTFDEENARLYVNGTLEATEPRSGDAETSSGALRIGGNSIWGEYFEGLIDEVRVYEQARSRSEIREDMATSISDPFSDDLPTIEGEPELGKTLRGVPPASPSLATYSYQWQRCDEEGANCEDLDGATRRSHQLGAGDHGATLRVVVTTHIGELEDESTSEATDEILEPPATVPEDGGPSIPQVARVGRTIEIDPGDWANDFAYQWRRCDGQGNECADIAGATSAQYEVVEADVGHTLRGVATGSTTGGAAVGTTPPTNVVPSRLIFNTEVPSVSADLTIEGTALTADPGEWEGDEPIDFTYQWQSCGPTGGDCAAITGEQDQDYLLTEGDAGSTIRVKVTAKNSDGSDEARSAQTAVIDEEAPTSVGAPTIVGDSAVDGELYVEDGIWSGLAPLQLSYQWSQCDSAGDNCVEVPGATSDFYSLLEGDVDSTFKVAVTAENAFGDDTVTTGASEVIAESSFESPSGPEVDEPPAITGSAEEGATLTADPGEWDGDGDVTFSYQWQVCGAGYECSDIDDATASTYEANADDIGYFLRVVVTAEDDSGLAIASAHTGQSVRSADGPANTAAPVISGTAKEGEALSVSEGSWTGDSPFDYEYQWFACGPADLCDDIDDADEATHDATAEDVGHYLVVAVTATDADGETTTVRSSASAAVVASSPVATAAPSIEGDPIEGEELTVDDGTWEGDLPITLSYQWRSCSSDGDDCADISGETDPTYTLGAGDIGTTIRVEVTGTNSGDSAAAVTEPTAPVSASGGPTLTAPITLVETPQEGVLFTGDHGTWTGTGTIDYAYQWQSCSSPGPECHNIEGADEIGYTPDASDEGTKLRLLVTASDSAGSTIVSSSVTRTVIGEGSRSPDDFPVKLVNLPSISGVAEEFKTVTATPGDWTGEDLTFEYKWLSCNAAGSQCAPIEGQTEPSYNVGSGDVGSTLRVWVKATSGSTTHTVSSAPSAVVEAHDYGVPEVWGDAIDGSMLYGGTGQWDPETEFEFQWQRCNDLGTECVDIEDADSQEYRIGTADIDHSIRLEVTGTTSEGPEVRTSLPTAVVVESSGAPTPGEWPPSVYYDGANDGQILYADYGGWTGHQGLSYEYEWLRCDGDGDNCTTVSGETSDHLETDSGDLGNTFRVRVTATNPFGSDDATSEATEVLTSAPPSLGGAPAVSASSYPILEGAELSADSGYWYGSKPSSFSYQWERCDGYNDGCSSIVGATNETYTVVEEDESRYVRVQVTATNAYGSDAAASESFWVEPPPAPEGNNTERPTISGDPRYLEELTADEGEWDFEPDTYEYQWEVCNQAVTSCSAYGTASTFTLHSTNFIGRKVRLKVTALASDGTHASAWSDPTDVVNSLDGEPWSSAPPTIEGEVEAGGTLTATPGEWAGDQPIDFLYRWQRCQASNPTSCNDIGGATDSTYEVPASYVGYRIRVKIVAVHGENAALGFSGASGVVVAGRPRNLSPPGITGTAAIGNQMMGYVGAWNDGAWAPLDFSLVWERCDEEGLDCEPIPGQSFEVAGPYTPGPADLGHRLRVTATAVRDGYDPVTVSSATTAVVIESTAPTNTGAPSITGNLVSYETLIARPGSWQGTGDIRFNKDWLRCDEEGAGCVTVAEGRDQYELTSADVGNTIRVRVTASNGRGDVVKRSAASEVVEAAPPAPPIVNVTPPGTPVRWTGVDRYAVNFSSPSEWTGEDEVDGQWQLCDPLTEDPGPIDCVDIENEDSSWYDFEPEDVIGFKVRWKETAMNRDGTSSAVSPTTAVEDYVVPDESAQAEGVPVVGAVISADRVVTGDNDRLPVELDYEFLRENPGDDPTPLQAGSSNEYVVDEEDLGHRIVVRVNVATKRIDQATTVSERQLETTTDEVEEPPTNTSLPTIDGDARVSQTLTANPGDWDGGAGHIEFEYQWKRCDAVGESCVNIEGADQESYMLQDDDRDLTVRVHVSASSGGISGDDVVSGASDAVVAADAPISQTPPVISGGVAEGGTLTVSPGNWAGDGPITYDYQWAICDATGENCSAVDTEVSTDLLLDARYVGSTIIATVTATGPGGAAAASSVATDVIEGSDPPELSDFPAIAGPSGFAAGTTVSTDGGTWTNAAGFDREYQWQRCNWMGVDCEEIEAETDATYALSDDDVGQRLRVRVVVENSSGNAAATSGASPLIASATPSVEGKFLRTGGGAVSISDLDGENATTLATCADFGDGEECELAHPVLSPDQSMLAVTRHVSGEDRHVWVSQQDGSDALDLGPGADPTWNFDGTEVIFSRQEPESDWQSHLVSVRADGSNIDTPVSVTSGSGSETGPQMSPDGSTLLFTQREPGSAPDGFQNPYRLVTADPDGSNRKTLSLPSDAFDAASPVWSDDGSKIYYEGTVHADTGYPDMRFPVKRIFSANTDGSGAELVTPDPGDFTYTDPIIVDGKLAYNKARWWITYYAPGISFDVGKPNCSLDETVNTCGARVAAKSSVPKAPNPRTYQPTFKVERGDGFWPSRFASALQQEWDGRRTCIKRRDPNIDNENEQCVHTGSKAVLNAFSARGGEHDYLDLPAHDRKAGEQRRSYWDSIGIDRDQFNDDLAPDKPQWDTVYRNAHVYFQRGPGLRKNEDGHIDPEVLDRIEGGQQVEGKLRDIAHSYQYWVYYSYNYLRPVAGYSGKNTGKHEGDWEATTILFDSKWNPRYVLFGRHEKAGLVPWNDATLKSKREGKTTTSVYVARGSHAAYQNWGVKSRPFPAPDDRIAKADLLKFPRKTTKLLYLRELKSWSCWKGKFGSNLNTLGSVPVFESDSPGAPLRQQGLYEKTKVCPG